MLLRQDPSLILESKAYFFDLEISDKWLINLFVLSFWSNIGESTNSYVLDSS